jgi:glycerophosphoryl diester phosphodiesterase
VHDINLKISSTTFEELNSKISVLLLADLLDFAISNKKNLAIETKHPNRFGSLIERKVNQLLIQRSGDIKRSGIEINLMSFSLFATNRNMKTQFSSVYLVKDLRLLRLLTAGTVGISIDIVRKNPTLILKLNSKGKRVFVWTVNEIADYELCSELNVSAIITDNPAQARSALR